MSGHYEYQVQAHERGEWSTVATRRTRDKAKRVVEHLKPFGCRVRVLEVVTRYLSLLDL